MVAFISIKKACCCLAVRLEANYMFVKVKWLFCAVRYTGCL